MSDVTVGNMLLRVEGNFNKKYERESAKGIIILLRELSDQAIEEICQYVVDNCRYMPKYLDFKEAMGRVGAKNVLKLVTSDCCWCESTGLVAYYHVDTMGEINYRCDCPAGNNVAQSIPRFSSCKYKNKYRKLKHGQVSWDAIGAKKFVMPEKPIGGLKRASFTLDHPELFKGESND